MELPVSEPMNKAYSLSVSEHTEEHFESLDELAETLASRDLTFIEKSAAARSMQVLVGAGIGLSKHICKKAGKQALGDAAACVTKALSILSINRIEPIGLQEVELRGAVGMRNAIVHDYLNFDWDLLAAVIVQQKYQNLRGFIQDATIYLSREEA